MKKRIIGFIMALVMVLSLSVVAYGDLGTGPGHTPSGATIIIEPPPVEDYDCCDYDN